MFTKRQIKNIDPTFDIDNLPQPVVSYGHNLKKGEVLPFHFHKRAQLVFASDGVMMVKTHESAFLIPPQRAVWMPAGIEHQIEAQSDVKMRTIYIQTEYVKNAMQRACVIQVSPLLRELIIEAVSYGMEYEPDSSTSRLMLVILDQIQNQSLAPSLTLAIPTDVRLKAITQTLIDDPSDSRELKDWANHVGASVRTLVRLFPQETGMTFRQWRQQRRLLRALELLSTGESVTNIALELGYETTSSFIAMFRRCLGTTPTNYLN